jgi:hypothetical protein
MYFLNSALLDTVKDISKVDDREKLKKEPKKVEAELKM